MQSSGAIFVHPRYVPGPELGRGAQGIVVRVTDLENPMVPLVAKVWQGQWFHPSTLQGEFAILSRLRIPGLVRAHDLARCEKTGVPFLIENFVDGPDVNDWLAEVSNQGKGARVVMILTAISSTLARLHESGFLHGDLKPAHIRIVPSGQTFVPMLLDLGAAVSKARNSSATHAFTPDFAAPEVRAGSSPSVVSDLYGLGATVFAMVNGAAPGARPRLRFFEDAPWLPPTVAALIDDLLATHPQDRPQSARDVLHRLGIARLSPGLLPLPMGRETEVAALRQAKPATVRWIVGPSGSGKTHLLRELHTQMLLDGRDVRFIRFPADGEITGKLVSYLRGDDTALPFTFTHSAIEKPVVFLDDAHLAPEEVHAALDVFRCRYAAMSSRIEFIVATREAPRAAEATRLAPLDDHAFQALCEGLGIYDRAKIQELTVTSGKNPGWLIAALGAIPLERDTALDRARTLSLSAQDLLSVFALSGGELPESVCRRVLTSASMEDDALAELSAAALITRHSAASGLQYSLYSPNLSRDLATALETPERWSLATTAWLAESFIPTTVLLALSMTTSASSIRTRLLECAAKQSRAEGVRSQEIEALLALVNDDSSRSVERLLRLERLLRDGQGSAAYPRVIEWLDAVAKHDSTILPLVLRRHAEKLAREGKTIEAAEVAERARVAAINVNDRVSAALALATRGVAALYRADWEEAELCLDQARNDLNNVETVDKEELARIDHNIGVVALYRGRVAEAITAFERALVTKRHLGDRAGIRSCLLNLGLALSKSKKYDDAERVLQESLELARSLGQTTGQGWCLVARAEVCIRRQDAAKAREWLAEAMQLESSLPEPIRADLALLQAEAALLVGDGFTATNILEKLDSAIRASDALVDTRALVLESRACLTRLPIAKRRAAQLAIRAIRRARNAKLVEMETEGITALRAARSMHPPVGQPKHSTESTTEADVWPWLAMVSTGISFDAAASSFAQLVIRASGAERVFLATIDAGGNLIDAVGVDLDGMPLAMPTRRIALDILSDALRTTTPILRRDLATSGHRGCRLAMMGPKPENDGPRALLLLEHRFLPTAFDHLSANLAYRWAILTGVLWTMHRVREKQTSIADQDSSLSTTNKDTSQIASPVHRGQTTYFPALERRRQIPAIIGHSVALDRALMRLEGAIDSDLPTLIIGETGTGKELFARALHDFGRRCAEPFVAVNCGAIPDSLFEAELFGHIRGSFTGAERTRSGLLARAAKGTLFLDEIGELPLLRQATLLRVLQDRCYRQVGSDEEISFDVRIVAATNRDLTRAVESGAFRRDLLYRLNTLEISVPPLRERTGDIAELARIFLARAGSKASLSPDVINALEAYPWPGNVRELEHVMQRLAMQQVATIERSFLPRELRVSALQNPPRGRSVREGSLSPDDAARIEVEKALQQCQGNISQAASLLGITRHGLKKRMVRLGLRAPSGG